MFDKDNHFSPASLSYLFPNGIMTLNKKEIGDIEKLQLLTKDYIFCVKYEELNEQNKTLLDKIIASVKLDSYEILTLTSSLPFVYFQNQSHIKTIVFFGFSTDDLALKIPLRTNTNYTIDHLSIILSNPLAEIYNDRQNEKKWLWVAMRDMFGI